jgi:hypothetical protein
MKLRILGLTLILAAATCVRAGTPAYVQCGTYDSYLLLYRSLDKFEELGKLRCSEKIEILAHVPGFYQVRVEDGRVGWVIDTDVSTTPPPPHHAFTFGMTEAPKPAAVPVAAKRDVPAGALTNEDIIALHGNAAALAVMLDKMKSTPCDFDTSPLAIRRLRSAQVPDKVILAMLATPVASEERPEEAATTLAVRIPVDTGIELHVKHDVPGDGLLDGAVIDLTADEDLVVHGQLIVVKGATARARVLGLRAPGSMTHPGQVAWFLQDIATVQGGFVPAIFAAKQTGKLHPKLLDGYPFFLSSFDKGEIAIRAAHSEVRAVLVAGTVLQIPQRPTAGGPEMTAKEQTQAVAPKEETAKPAELKPVAVTAASASPSVTAAPSPVTEAAATPPAAPSPTTTAPAAAHQDATADPPAAAQSFAEPPSK